MTKNKIVLIVDNEVGVLAKIAGLLAGKSCNIEFITSERTENSSMLRLTIEVSGSEAKMPHLCDLLAKMLPVHSVQIDNI